MLGVTSPKDVYTVDLPRLSNLVFLVALTVPSASFSKNLTISFKSVLAKAPHSVSCWIDPVILGSFMIPGALAPDPRIGKQSL